MRCNVMVRELALFRERITSPKPSEPKERIKSESKVSALQAIGLLRRHDKTFAKQTVLLTCAILGVFH